MPNPPADARGRPPNLSRPGSRPPERSRQELDLQLALGVRLFHAKGQGSPEVAATYRRALELCQQVGTPTQLSIALHGLRRVQYARGELRQAVAYGTDFGVICVSYGALALQLLGYPEQALQRSQQALALARELRHPFSLAFALHKAAMFHQFRREAQATQARAEAALALAADQGFPLWSVNGRILRGWALAMQDRAAEGGEELRQGLAAYQARGFHQIWTYYLGLYAEAYGAEGRVEAGLETLAEALDTANHRDERAWEAELYRLGGELHEPLHPTEAETWYQRALDSAREQQARWWELRAAMRLGRLWQQQGRRTEARELLEPIYGWFTEGFDTADLRQAKAFLEQLA